MYTEAIATYQAITRNRMFSNSGRLKVNMGNIYVKMGQLPQAIKMYRMAFDQAPIAHKDLRYKAYTLCYLYNHNQNIIYFFF